MTSRIDRLLDDARARLHRLPAAEVPAAPAVELHGGSVPAPAQKVPGR